MWWYLAAAVASGIISYFTTKYNMSKTEDINKLNIDYQSQQNQINLDNQWKMYEENKEYNTPEAQMERYREAGLNPNLIYGQSNTIPAMSISSQSAPEASNVPQMNNEGIQEAIKSLQNVPFIKEMLTSKREDNRQKKIQTDLLALELEAKQYDLMGKRVDFAKNAKMLEKLDDWINIYYDSKLGEMKTPGEKIKLMESQMKVNESIEKIKGLEAKYKYGDGLDSKGEMELKLEAMEVANSIRGIDLDFRELEKNIGSGSKIAMVFLQYLRMFLSN